MKTHELPFEKCDVLIFGRELVERERPDGTPFYEPSYRTIQNTDTVGAFWQQYDGTIGRIVTSGGYPQAALGMSKPQDGSSEAAFMMQRLHQWGVTTPVTPEENSTNTFENLTESRQYLRVNEYNEHDPLVVACNEAHAARVVMLTRYALDLTLPHGQDNLYLVRPYPETDAAAHEKERKLAKLTKLAIALADQEAFPPGAPDASMHLLATFASLWGRDEIEEDVRRRHALVRHVEDTYGEEWELEDLRQTEIIDVFS
jgi:hypothetical protein